MKKVLFFATVLLALYSCTNNDYVGNQDLLNNDGNGAISFNSNSGAITRAAGAEAATLLNNNFVVEGIKTVNSSAVEVFDNYNVNWTENTAGTTNSNSANWEYVAQSILSGKTSVSEQSIKYWDFAASQYDFWAYSLGGGSATVSSLAHDATLTSSAYTVEGTKDNLSKVYISDLQTAYAASAGVTGKPVMRDQVNLTFRSLLTKVRIGLYETIPGYSVKNVQFYPSESGTPGNDAILYAAGSVIPTYDGSSKAKFVVKFPTIGSDNASNSDYNKAHVTLDDSGTKTTNINFGTLSYGAKHKYEKTDGDIWLRVDTKQPTWAKETSATAGDYSIVLPYESGTVLTLKVDYTLESTDGSGETITVHGATALIPSQFTQWKANYAYTYLFKISDNTNGLTNTSVTDKKGLYPITLDAVVTATEDGTQETITTVATPSITTYSLTSNVTSNDVYTTSDDIYVTVSTDGSLMSQTDKVTLYDITKSSAAYAATEAEVLAALTTYSDYNSTTKVYTGRNSVLLTPITDGFGLAGTTIPTVDGQTITVGSGEVSLIAKNKLTAGHYYAFVYNTTSGTPTTEDKYEAVSVTAGSDVSKYYNRTGEGTVADPYVYTQASGTAAAAATYYDKYTTSTATYAIKVIKIKS